MNDVMDHDHDHERDHECQRCVRIGLRISKLYESVYTKGDRERGWKLPFSGKSQRLPPERIFMRWSHEIFLVNQSVLFFRHSEV